MQCPCVIKKHNKYSRLSIIPYKIDGNEKNDAMQERKCYNDKKYLFRHRYDFSTILIRMKDGGKLGKKDSVTKEYMRNPIVFADAFNKYLYHGRQVIQPENLRELDTAEIAVPYGSGGAGVPEQRSRDVLKTVMTDGNMVYCILGIENQSDINYAIPVKNGLYDFMQLAHQVAATAKSHKREEKENAGRDGCK